jgi:Fe-S cluster biogenesis protein NfuA
MTIDRDALAERVDQLNRYIAMHAGGLEVEHAGSAGDVVVRFTGMCTGCLYREATMAATVRPALLEIEGVSSVEAAGGRVSAQAAQRLAHAHSGPKQMLPAWAVPTDLPRTKRTDSGTATGGAYRRPSGP